MPLNSPRSNKSFDELADEAGYVAANDDKKAPKPKSEKWSRRKTGSEKKATRSIIVAGAVATVAFGVPFILLTNSTEATVPVPVLNQNISANTPATADLFTITELPASNVDGEIIPIEALDGESWFAEEDLQAGMRATTANFNETSRIDISTLDDPTLLAQTFAVSRPESAVNYRVRPGDYINILAVSQDGGEGVQADFILSKVLVLGVDPAAQAGQPLTTNVDPTAPYGAQTAGNVYTVALNPEQTQILARAAAGSALSVVLTRPDAPDLVVKPIKPGEALTTDPEAGAVDPLTGTDTTAAPTAAPTVAPVAPDATAATN